MNSSSKADTLESLLRYCTARRRLVPMPERWNALFQILKNTRRKPSGAGMPPPPLILAAWHHSMPLEKKMRFREHLRWADDQGQIEEVGRFLRSLPESDWCHMGEIEQPSGEMKKPMDIGFSGQRPETHGMEPNFVHRP